MAPKSRPYPFKIASWAFLALPITFAAFYAIAAVVPDDLGGGIAGPLIMASVLGLVFGLALRRGRFAAGAAVFSLLLTLIGVMIGSGYGLRHPESFFEFVGSLVLLIAPLVAFVATVAGITARRRHMEATSPTRRQRRLLLGLGVGVALAATASGVVSVLTGPVAVGPGEVARVLSADDRFEPAEFAVRSGDEVGFVIRNDDSYAHTFSIDALDVDVYLGPGANRTIPVEVDAEPGDLRLYCAINGHDNMIGKIVVTSVDPS